MTISTHVSRFVLIPLIGVLLVASGCSGGGGGGNGNPAATPQPAPGTTVINGVSFAADSDVLTDSPFGEAFGIRTIRVISKGKLQDYFTTKTFTGSTVGNVRSLTVRIDFIDASGQPVTNNFLLELAKAIINSTERISLAKAVDGWIYFVAYGDTPLEKPIKVYPSQVTVGSEWSWVSSDATETNTYRVIAMDVTAPRSGISGCVLLRSIESEEGKAEETDWSYYKAGIGLVESTDTDPTLDQSEASGSYLVPNIG